MSSRFIIEDESHAEWHSEHPSLFDAAEELKRLAGIPWDQRPNVAPCQSWKTCGRKYEVVEYDSAKTPWRELRRLPALEINAKGVLWDQSFPLT